MRYVLCLAYDGTNYLGWQRTYDGPSIEETLSTALQQILREPISLRAASRTDRGVHALEQIVDFQTIKSLENPFIISLNALLPTQIRARSIMQAPPSFHPTTDAVKKWYRYQISTGPVQLPHHRHTHWHVHYPLDLDLLRKAAQICIGTHDFRGLCNRRNDLNEEDTHRTVHSITIEEKENQLYVDIKANSFLYKMARNIVGTLIWIARGKIPIQSLSQALQTRKRAEAGVTAPAHGLTLMKVTYPPNLIDFEINTLYK